MPRLLEVDDLRVRFRLREGTLHAVDRVSFSLGEGETLGIASPGEERAWPRSPSCAWYPSPPQW